MRLERRVRMPATITPGTGLAQWQPQQSGVLAVHCIQLARKDGWSENRKRGYDTAGLCGYRRRRLSAGTWNWLT